jgi:hypothetical protein
MRDDKDCTNAYRKYLKHTLEVLDIKLVISLGLAPAWFLAQPIGAEWGSSSRNVSTKKHLDVAPLCHEEGVVYVKATHPAHWDANTKLRQLEQYGGEIGLLINSRKLAGIPDAPGWTPRIP